MNAEAPTLWARIKSKLPKTLTQQENELFDRFDACLAALSSPHTPPAVEPTLPIEIYGKLYDVPIAVQVHIVALEERLETAAPAQPVEPVALTDARFNAQWEIRGPLRMALLELPRIDEVHINVFDALRAFDAVLAAAQEVEFTDDPVPTYKPGPPLEWEEGGA